MENLIDQFFVFFDAHRIFIDLGFFAIGVFYARLRPYFFAFRVAIIAARALRTYFKMHRTGRAAAILTTDDEMVDTALASYEDNSCLGPGKQATETV